MKILFHAPITNVDAFFKKFINTNESYHKNIEHLVKYGSISKFGFNVNNRDHFLSISNFYSLLKIWAHENNLIFHDGNDNEIYVLNNQIEKFRPDVLFTTNPEWVSIHYNELNLSNISLLACWRASPINSKIPYSFFQLGLSFNDIYKKLMKNQGVSNVETHHFNFNSDIINSIPNKNKLVDVSFLGTYNDFMFKKRTFYLHKIFDNYFPKRIIRYHFRTAGNRLFGLLPKIPLKFIPVYRRPLFLRDYLSVIKSSKITFNCHSDMNGFEKGNIRIFEALGMKTFLLTDYGQYPPNLVDGQDFVSYKDEKDLISKIKYFLKHDKEREEIATHGYEKLKKYYNLGKSSQKLETIFSYYL